MELSGDELVVGYNTPLFSKTFKVRDIDEMQACEVNGLVDWGGWGIRGSLRGNGWGYICRNGSGISLLDTGNKTKYTFNCENPQLLMAQIHTLRSDTGTVSA